MYVAAVIVTYNRRDKLRQCLDAVIRQKGSAVPDIIIVDNNSTDGTADMVRTCSETAGIELTDDPRVTRIGRKIRHNSLDELPQLFNVIKGEMSLVGPRPIMESELGFYTPDEQRRLLSVRPGITGYWQVNGRNDATYQTGRRQELELYYADHASLLLDALILIKTPAAVFLGKGAK